MRTTDLPSGHRYWLVDANPRRSDRARDVVGKVMKASQGKKLTLKEAGEKFGYTLTDYEWDYKRKFVELRK